MPSTTCFYVKCPTCGRSLQVRIAYLGKAVACQHCRGEFEAIDPTCGDTPNISKILNRADELLHSLELRTEYPR